MAKNQRKMAPKGTHSEGSYAKKTGRRMKSRGKQTKRKKKHFDEAKDTHRDKIKMQKLLLILALQNGESMNAGMARMALLVTLRLVDEAELVVKSQSLKVAGLRSCFRRAAELTSSSIQTISNLFWSYIESDGETFHITDNSGRGRGSETINWASLYKISEEQTAVIKAFVDFRHGTKGACKAPPG